MKSKASQNVAKLRPVSDALADAFGADKATFWDVFQAIIDKINVTVTVGFHEKIDVDVAVQYPKVTK